MARSASELYREYRCCTTKGWGPYTQFDPEFNTRIAPLLKEMTSVFSEAPPDKLTDGSLRFCSAWHAVLHLIQMQFISVTSPIHKHLVFRGHSDASWPLLSTSERASPVDREVDRLASWLFVQTIRRKIRGVSSLMDQGGLLALARHYGLASHLLDFSADPAVAVWFACQGDSHGSGDARVLTCDTKSFVSLGGGLVAPPPVERRMYRQVALAIDTRGFRTRDFGQRCQSVVFPTPTDKEEFLLYRDGNEIFPLAADKWLVDTADQCRFHSAASGSVDSLRDFRVLLDEVSNSVEEPPANLTGCSQSEFALWAIEFVDWLHWVVIGVNLARTQDIASMDTMLSLVRSNPVVTRLAIKVLTLLGESGVVPGVDRILRMLLDVQREELPGRHSQGSPNVVVLDRDTRNAMYTGMGLKPPSGYNGPPFRPSPFGS